MTWSAFSLNIAASLRNALIFTVALGCFVLLRRRLRTDVQSCEEKTGSDSLSRRTRAPSLLLNNRDCGELKQGRSSRLNSSPTPANYESGDEDPSMGRRVKQVQSYDAFLVLDVEATCVEGSDFAYPNEIIEWPVCLLRWKDMDMKGKARELAIVAEFRSFVRPTWRPELSNFCQTLTGITQDQVNTAPTFPEVLQEFRGFLEEYKLLDEAGHRLERFCFCSDGPYDVRDFVVKQCFISKIQVPAWLSWDVMDVRRVVRQWQDATTAVERRQVGANTKRMSFSISRQLIALGLEPFEGRQHSGIDDTRNICRLVIELARRGWRLEPNTTINPNRRWPWMGRKGKILEEYYP